MIQKQSYGFNTFAATRIGEIQESTNPTDWYWTESEYNIADYLTRGKHPYQIGLNSLWQNRPNFLLKPEDQWPITRTYVQTKELPERLPLRKVTILKTANDNLVTTININRYSSYKKLLRVTARILLMYKKKPKPTFKNATKVLISDIEQAEIVSIKECQKTMEAGIKDGKYKRLCPKLREDGIYAV